MSEVLNALILTLRTSVQPLTSAPSFNNHSTLVKIANNVARTNQSLRNAINEHNQRRRRKISINQYHKIVLVLGKIIKVQTADFSVEEEEIQPQKGNNQKLPLKRTGKAVPGTRLKKPQQGGTEQKSDCNSKALRARDSPQVADIDGNYSSSSTTILRVAIRGWTKT